MITYLVICGLAANLYGIYLISIIARGFIELLEVDPFNDDIDCIKVNATNS